MSETTVISAEIIKKAMRIRSGIIIGYPNPCAYTDRFQGEYNALVVYLAVHYPDDKELSTYAPVFTEISTWEQAVKAANDGTVHKLVAVDDSINGHFDNSGQIYDCPLFSFILHF